MSTFNHVWKTVLDTFSIKVSDFTNNGVLISKQSLKNWRSRSLPDNQDYLNLALDFLCSRIEKLAKSSLNVYVSYILALDLNNNVSITSPTELSTFVRDLLIRIFIKEDTNRRSGKNAMDTRSIEIKPPRTKAVVFDFDGTLTAKKTSQSTWENIWLLLGYSIRDCQDLHAQFNAGKIASHQDWCDITATRFIEKGLNKIHLNKIISQVTLLDDIEYVFNYLYERNIKIYIVSGSIYEIISAVLGDLRKYVREIKANEFDFDDKTGNLIKIHGTKYDFEGKAHYITEVAKGGDPACILFVGNSNNDKYAHLSGARTVCINPHFADPTDTKVWNAGAIPECKSLKEILHFVEFE